MPTFSLLSDVHLEFNDCPLINTHNTDVLVLAGDITVFSLIDCLSDKFNPILAVRTDKFFQMASQEWQNVIYLLGNHEFYHGKRDVVVEQTRRYLTNFKNISLLDYYADQSIEIDDVIFVGGTLWTDIWLKDVMASQYIQKSMNDFQVIFTENRSTFTLKDSFYEFQRTFDNIRQQIAITKEHQKVIVVTHHAPCSLSVADQFKGNLLNGGFYSDLSNYILDNTNKINYWLHGHMHNTSDYLLENTRILCNPKGYQNTDILLESYSI